MTQTRSFKTLVDSGTVRGVVYLAGFPRSGAALIRTVLVHCFGQHTMSLYDESGIGEAYSQAMNLVTPPLPEAEFLRMIQEQGIVTVKTHQRPAEPVRTPTIVITRDGRRTLESLGAFYHERNGLDVTMDQLIRGDHPWQCWTAWHRAWAALAPRDALWLRYEDVMADVAGTVDLLAAQFALTPRSHEIPPFEALQNGTPTIFRKADVSTNGGLTEQQEALFWSLHGGTMTMLGYHRE